MGSGFFFFWPPSIKVLCSVTFSVSPCRVAVAIVGNGLGDPSSKPVRGCSLNAYTFGEGMNPAISK